MKNILVLLVCFLAGLCRSYAQKEQMPKLIVGIVVDQMRAEYLYRFQDNYSERGFKRLMKDGYNFKNIHYTYVPTETAPGHASIYTGTTPANHGIVSNNWYDREKKKTVYCVQDDSEKLIGTTDPNPISGGASPRNLMAATFSDELKLFTNKRSNVIGISMKDRGAILPVGHLADYAFWYDDHSGNLVSSTFYNTRLPAWVTRFNTRKVPDSLLNQTWDLLLPADKYTHSSDDNQKFERIYKGKQAPVFPYDLKQLKNENGGYRLLMETPLGNTFLTDFAMKTIAEEKLGEHESMDFLSISFSSTDKVGHDFGIRSKEIEDTYIRLDRDLARLLDYLDSKVGKDKYLLFLTADHASSDNPAFLKEEKTPSGFYNLDSLKTFLNNKVSADFGQNEYISYVDNTQLYVNPDLPDKRKILEKIEEYLYTVPGVKQVFIPGFSDRPIANNATGEFVKRSFNRSRSGDIYFQFYPGWMQSWKYGTTHYTAYNDDTHVPLLWYGWEIRKDESIKYHAITSIVPTLSLLLNVPIPNEADIKPLEEITR